MEIIWNKNGDDYTAVVGEYELTVIRYSVYCKWVVVKKRRTIMQETIANGQKSNSIEAKAAAENAYFKHIESANPNTKL